MPVSLSDDSIRRVKTQLARGRARTNKRPDRVARQPVHTVYGGAHLFRHDFVPRLGAAALRVLDEYAPDAASFSEAIGRSPDRLMTAVYDRVRDKLGREPVEDFRIDFEDGYGNRPDDEEDGHAASAAREVAHALKAGTLSPGIGIRIKPFSEELQDRSIRTLDIFVSTLAGLTQIPSAFVVTLPKVTFPDQVAALADLLDTLERSAHLESGSLNLEVMIETPESVIGPGGASSLPLLVDAAHGRMAAAHFGTYDYTASLNISAAEQRMGHAACDFARQTMQVALANSGVWLSDGATNILPVAPHRVRDHQPLSASERAENKATVHRAWKFHYDDVMHSLVNAYYQGWDLHPAQLPTRFAAVYIFFLEGLDSASDRLRNFIGRSAQATLVGDIFDDAATGQGLLNYFLRALNCGAISESEAVERSGLTLDELRTRSFLTVLKNRRSS